jgi:hypothetical protein
MLMSIYTLIIQHTTIINNNTNNTLIITQY